MPCFSCKLWNADKVKYDVAPCKKFREIRVAVSKSRSRHTVYETRTCQIDTHKSNGCKDFEFHSDWDKCAVRVRCAVTRDAV